MVSPRVEISMVYLLNCRQYQSPINFANRNIGRDRKKSQLPPSPPPSTTSPESSTQRQTRQYICSPVQPTMEEGMLIELITNIFVTFSSNITNMALWTRLFTRWTIVNLLLILWMVSFLLVSYIRYFHIHDNDVIF